MSSTTSRLQRLCLLLVLVLVPAGMARARAGQLSPEETLRRYLGALQNENFDKAYDYVSKAMKTDRKTGQIESREAWAKERQYIFEFSGAQIFSFDVGKARIEDDTALVPNLLSSKDQFVNQLGLDEHELYTLVKEDGAWKVDRQKEVIERSEIAKWFPKEGKKR
jgi:hypothetical protein